MILNSSGTAGCDQTFKINDVWRDKVRKKGELGRGRDRKREREKKREGG